MNSNKILIDAHIHIHDCYDLDVFFDTAQKNFESQANITQTKHYQSVLCLTESHGTNYFHKLKTLAEKKEDIKRWTIKTTENDNTLVITKDDSFNIFLIAGRQIVTSENLEVLALGLIEDPNDGTPINEVLNYTTKRKVISVIPWGVGKWFGTRKQVVEQLIVKKEKYSFYLGDNANRPFFWPKPKLFENASKRGIFNISGSDPLPFKNGIKKPGSFGLIINDVLDNNNPFDSLHNIILSANTQFTAYGKLESLPNFLKNQISMQVVKRRRKGVQ